MKNLGRSKKRGAEHYPVLNKPLLIKRLKGLIEMATGKVKRDLEKTLRELEKQGGAVLVRLFTYVAKARNLSCAEDLRR